MMDLLRRQPNWLAMMSLEDLARRLDRPQEARTFRRAARHELRRFGFAVVTVAGAEGALALGALIAILILGIRAFLTRERPSLPWLTDLGWVTVVDLLDVVAAMAFCNVLGQVLRRLLLGGLPPDAPLSLVGRMGHYFLVAIPALVLVVNRATRYGSGWREALGLRWRGGLTAAWQSLLALGLTLLAAPSIADAFVSGLFVVVSHVGAAGGGPGGSTPAALAVNLLLSLFLAPVVEEVVFRGFIFRALYERLHMIVAAGASALLFAAIHLPWQPEALVGLFLLGMVTAYTYRATRSVWPGIIAHAGYNASVLAAIHVLRM